MATLSVARSTHHRTDPLQPVLYGAMLVVMTLAMVPFVWAFLTSLKPEKQVFAFPPQLLPNPATLYNYGRAIDHGLLLALFNSTVISLTTVGLVLVAGSLAAYALARITFRGSQLVLFLIIAPMMIPGLVNLVPTYIVMAKLRSCQSSWKFTSHSQLRSARSVTSFGRNSQLMGSHAPTA